MDIQSFRKLLRENRFKRKHFSQDKISTISESNLQQVVLWFAPERLIYKNGHFYITKGHEEEEQHIVLYENTAHDHYMGRTFPPVLFLQEFLDLSFPQAVYLLNYFYYKVQKAPLRDELQAIAGQCFASKPTSGIEELDLTHFIREDRLSKPETKDYALKRAIAYLHKTRGIDKDIVLNFMKQDFLTMDRSGNLCFITYQDPLNKDNPIAVTQKGTLESKPFKCNLTKEHNTGFFYAKKEFLQSRDYKTLYVFEAVIDLLSFLSLVKQGRIFTDRQSENCCYIALNGANNTLYIDKVLGEYATIDTIILGLDNDHKGITAAKEIEQHIEQTFSDRVVLDMQDMLRGISKKYGYCKDFNDVLRLPIVQPLGEI